MFTPLQRRLAFLLPLLCLYFPVATLQNLLSKDIPSNCSAICQPISELTFMCLSPLIPGFDGMTTGIKTTVAAAQPSTTNIQEVAADLFGTNHVRRYPFLDKGGKIGGLLDIGLGVLQEFLSKLNATAFKECLCDNSSFAVPRIGGLCVSCINQNLPTEKAEKRQFLAEKLLDKCAFGATATTETFSPEKTSLVKNMRITATAAGAVTTATILQGTVVSGKTPILSTMPNGAVVTMAAVAPCTPVAGWISWASLCVLVASVLL